MRPAPSKALHFVDIETTGLNVSRAEIIEIAIISDLPNGKSYFFSTKIKPNSLKLADPLALKLNGYEEALWKDAPTLNEVINQIYLKLKGGVIVGHNVHFDLLFLNHAFEKYRLPRLGRRSIDTITLAYEHLPTKSKSLRACRMFFKMSLMGSHRALKDCEDMREIYYRLIRAGALQRAWWKFWFFWRSHEI